MPKFDADVGVVGVGTVGSMAMMELTRRGASVLGFERYWSVPHDQAAYGGESRLYRSIPHLELGAGDVRITADSYDAWRQLEAESGRQLLMECGGLVIEPSGSPAVERLLGLISTGAIDAEVLSHEQMAERYPQFVLYPEDRIVFDPRGGWLRPELAVAAAAGLSVERGARILTGTEVLGWESDRTGVTVQVSGAEYRVRKLVVSPGGWATELLPGLRADAQRVVMAWYTPRSAQDTELFGADRFPSFTRTHRGEFSFGGPTLEGTMVKVSGAYSEIWGHAEKVGELNRAPGAVDLAPGRAHLTEILRGLDPAPARTGVWIESNSHDATAMLGHWRGDENIIVATSFSGYGFKICPVIGQIVADLTTSGITKYDITHMDPARFDTRS
ncbi:FAD-dependent oxidoreductase [Streptomyces sp. NPDC003781]|uniref:FAD-dependent oxidoreductase n=1 Tax=Streptomyces sp. NPDC003781 TaxID=3364686 RepID=UPI0036A1E77F